MDGLVAKYNITAYITLTYIPIIIIPVIGLLYRDLFNGLFSQFISPRILRLSLVKVLDNMIF